MKILLNQFLILIFSRDEFHYFRCFFLQNGDLYWIDLLNNIESIILSITLYKEIDETNTLIYVIPPGEWVNF